ncbi:putative two-component response regulator ARR19 [Primulina eburnea]|uniref:putative two-component response regulator ARR19 n=1 Tax=Primulina eburnea TaxID=1245227 RepID=UPI003C6C26F8
MVNKGICILVADGDLTCTRIVSDMLQHTSYEVLATGSGLDVLSSIWETKGRIELVLTNAQRLGPNGMEIVKHIKKKLHLPVTLMSPEKAKMEFTTQPNFFSAYILNNVSSDDINNLWQFASEEEKFKKISQSTPLSADECSTDETTLMEKKQRVVWTKEMHQKFLDAIELLGYERAVPKRIAEVMGIPGLRRENVASHLQKFRNGLKRAQEVSLDSVPGTSTMNEIERSCMLNNPEESTRRFIMQNKDTQKKDPFGATNRYTNFRASRLTDHWLQNGPLSPSFQIYRDQTKNMLLSTIKNTSSTYDHSATSSKPAFRFVGYRLTSDEKSIVLCTEDQNPETSVSLKSFDQPKNSQNEVLLLSPLTAESHWNENPDQEIYFPSRETTKNENLVQDSLAEDQQEEFEDVLIDVSGNTFPHMDWQEFEDAVFKQDGTYPSNI